MDKLTLKMISIREMFKLIKDEQGQDLVEYALVVGLIAFGAITGMNTLAAGINTAFGNIATTLASHT